MKQMTTQIKITVTTTHPQVFEKMVGPWGLEPQTSTVSR